MSNSKEVDALRLKVYLAYHRDGILDLAVGIIISGFSLFMVTGNVVFLAAGPIFASQYVPMKQRITIPRFGYVRFVSEKKSLAQSWFLVGLGVLVMFIVFALNVFLRNGPSSPEMQAWTQRYHMVPLSAALFGAPSLFVAVYLGLKRFYLYALLAVSLPALGAWLNVETFIPILAIGLVILAYGIGLLSSFLKQNPINNEVDDHAGE